MKEISCWERDNLGAKSAHGSAHFYQIFGSNEVFHLIIGKVLSVSVQNWLFIYYVVIFTYGIENHLAKKIWGGRWILKKKYKICVLLTMLLLKPMLG